MPLAGVGPGWAALLGRGRRGAESANISQIVPTMLACRDDQRSRRQWQPAASDVDIAAASAVNAVDHVLSDADVDAIYANIANGDNSSANMSGSVNRLSEKGGNGDDRVTLGGPIESLVTVRLDDGILRSPAPSPLDACEWGRAKATVV